MRLLSICCLATSIVTVSALGQTVPAVTALTAPWPTIERVDGIDIWHVQKQVWMLVGGGANVAAQVGDSEVVLVDAGGIGKGKQIAAAVKHMSEKPLHHLVVTSADPDTAGGIADIVDAAGGPSGLSGRNPATPEIGLMSIVHDNTLTRLTDGTPAFPALKGEPIPTSSFLGARKELYPNGEAMQIFFAPKAITDGDVIVFFRGSDVISTGHIFRTDSYPVIDPARGGTIQGELDALNFVLDLAVPERNEMGGTRIIPGHGRVCNESDVVEYRDMLTIIRDRVKAMVDAHATLADARNAHATLDYDGIYGKNPEMPGGKLIEIIYNELSGKK